MTNDNQPLLMRHPRWADVILNRFKCEARLRELSEDGNEKPVDRSTEGNGKDAEKGNAEDQREKINKRLKELRSIEAHLAKRHRNPR